jgi:hypothetical protein
VTDRTEDRAMHRFFIALFAVVFAWSGAAAAAEIAAAPVTFSSGAVVKVAAERLATNTNYRLRLEGASSFDLVNFNSGSSNSATLAPRIPTASAGSYELVLYSVTFTLTRVAATPVTVGVPLSVVLTPTTAPPGKAVKIVVSGLVAGSVRIGYAGKTILGPVPVGDGSWTGKFVVPSDRPSSLPATVVVNADNLVGKTVPGQGKASFAAQAPSGLPRIGVTYSAPPAPTIDRGAKFAIGGTLRDDEGRAPGGSSHLYWKHADGTVVPLDGDATIASDGTFAMDARAPDLYRNGYVGSTDRTGTLMIVNQGVDTNTDSDSDFIAAGSRPQVTFDGDDGGSTTFTLVIKGNGAGSNDPPLANAIVEAQAEYQNGFGYAVPGSGNGGNSSNDYEIVQSFGANQIQATRGAYYPNINRESYGCDVTAFRRPTNAQGQVTFTINPDAIQHTNFNHVIEDCFANGDCIDNEVQHRAGKARTGKATAAEIGDAIPFNRQVYAAHLGYRNYSVTLGYLPDTGEFVNVSDGTFFANNRGEILLEPSQSTDVDLRNLRIDGLGAPLRKPPIECDGSQAGECYYIPYIFGTVANGNPNGTIYSAMYVYPDTGKWPNASFSTFNSGRKARFNIDPAVSGTLSSGVIKLDGYPSATFVSSGAPTCVLDQTTTIEYVASLPDLTRAPATPIHGTVELRFGANQLPPMPIVILAQTPPAGIDRNNANIATLTIDALNDKITGSYNVRDSSIPVDPPGHGIGRLDNMSENVSDFSFTRTPDRRAAERITSASNNDVAGNAGGPRASEGVFFGFTDASHATPDPVVLFDTGVIPLFRYTWGLDPIAGATVGADFWLASELAYYGQLRSAGMNATIDPTVAGGVNLFFDLDVLLGLVSASVTAETELGVTMRSVIGAGGLAHRGVTQHNGECFRFDLGMRWEACAVGICADGFEPLIAARSPSGCATSIAGISPLEQKTVFPDASNFDLARPRPTATALATDGRGNTITVGVTAGGALVATHLSASIATTTRTIDTATVGVQHIDVTFYATNRAVAVWSENTRTAADVANLVQTQRTAAFATLVLTQRLRWSYFDGTRWSAPAFLGGTGSDGKPRLAGCIAPLRLATSTCPLGGEVTVVWEHEANGDLKAPDMEIWSSSWEPSARGWTTPARVSNAGTSSDMLPVVAYRGAVPLVVWAYNPAGHFANLAGRRAMYRFLDGSSGARIATALGYGVGWVSLAIDADDRPVIAFTKAQDAQGFVGNRRALSGAVGTCSGGACTFDVTEPRDANGRQYRVERPSVMFDADGTTLVGFRALGFGPNARGQLALDGDPPGTMLGTGEIGLIRVTDFTQPLVTAQFVPLTGDGLQHFKPSLAFDDTVGGVLAVSMDAPLPAGRSKALEAAKALSPHAPASIASAKGLGDGSTLRSAGGGPDFVLRSPSLTSRVVAGGQGLTLTVKLVNQGQAFDPAVHGSLKVVATWNAPAGGGVQAGSYTQTQLFAANATRTVLMPLTVPAGVTSDQRQTLFIDIVADDDANEIGGAADQLREVLNVMPVPQHVEVATRLDSTVVNLSWDAVSDSRVAGWRVWRLREDGTWKHLGSTTVPGYVDIFGLVGKETQYKVAAYSSNGMESEPSLPAWAKIEATPPADALFANGFE